MEEILNHDTILKQNTKYRVENLTIKNSNDRAVRFNPSVLNMDSSPQLHLETYQISPFQMQFYQKSPYCFPFPILKSPFHNFNMGLGYSPINIHIDYNST